MAPVEVTISFVNTFRHIMQAKMRRFFRRSLYRYALGAALVTLGIHANDLTLTPSSMLVRGLGYFLILCATVLTLLIISAFLQSRQLKRRTVTFTEDDVFVTHNGKTSARGWSWIIEAEESASKIALLVQRTPQLELFLDKAQLDDLKYSALHDLLVSHGKLHKQSSTQ